MRRFLGSVLVAIGALAAVSSAASLANQTPITPRLVDAQAIQELVGEQRGKIVLLNFWATWCRPCLVEFPEIVAVEKASRHRGLVVISVSADSPKNIDSDLLPFLEEYSPSFPIYVMQTDDLDAFMHRIDPEWNGSLPATFFIDRKGNVVFKRFSPMSREKLEQALDYLFAETEH